MNDRSRKWLAVRLKKFIEKSYFMDSNLLYCLHDIAYTAYGIETFEYFNLEIFGIDYVPVNENEFMSGIGDILLVETNSHDEIPKPKPLCDWIALYHKERRDKLARVAGIAPEDFVAPTTPTLPKM